MSAVNTYLDQFTGDLLDRLRAIQDLVAAEAPDAEEGIMYGLVGYRLHNKPLIYFGNSHTTLASM